MKNIFTELAEFFGGQVATASALGVTQGTVSGWVRGVHGCSADIALLAQQKTCGAFLASQLRPSLAIASPTVDQTIPDTEGAHQATNSTVQPSSTGGAA